MATVPIPGTRLRKPSPLLLSPGAPSLGVVNGTPSSAGTFLSPAYPTTLPPSRLFSPLLNSVHIDLACASDCGH